MIGPFGLGVLLPVIGFLVPYGSSGSVDTLLQGVFVLPAKRLLFPRMDPPSPAQIMAVLPILLLTVIAYYCSTPGLRLLNGVLAACGLCAILEMSVKSPLVYQFGLVFDGRRGSE